MRGKARQKAFGSTKKAFGSVLLGVDAFEDDLSDGVLGSVRDGEVRVRRAALFEEFEGTAAKGKRWRARLFGYDFHVVPRDAARPARAERLERCLLRGEARGVMLSGDRAARVAVGALGLSENALYESRRALDSAPHALYFDDVYADGNNHR